MTATSKANVLDHVDIRFAGAGGAGAVFVDGGDLAITNSTVRNSSAHGILGRNGAQLNVISSLLVRNSSAGLRLESNATATATNNTIEGNSRGVSASASTVTLVNNLITHHNRSGVFSESSATVNARSNVTKPPSQIRTV